MRQTKYALALSINLGLGFDFRPCREGDITNKSVKQYQGDYTKDIPCGPSKLSEVEKPSKHSHRFRQFAHGICSEMKTI